MSSSIENATAWSPASRRTRSTYTSATRGSATSGSTRSGCSPSRPSTTALTVPCPCPVAPSEPNISARTLAVRLSNPLPASRDTNACAARIGPTVCELDGPIPTLNRSKTLMVTIAPALAGRPRGHPRFRPVFRGADRVLEEEGRGDGTDASGNRGQAGGVLRDGGVDVAEQTTVVGGVGAHVDHDRVRANVPGSDQAGPPDGGDQDVGASGDRGEVGRPGVADRDRGVAGEQQVRQRLAHHC